MRHITMSMIKAMDIMMIIIMNRMRMHIMMKVDTMRRSHHHRNAMAEVQIAEEIVVKEAEDVDPDNSHRHNEEEEVDGEWTVLENIIRAGMDKLKMCHRAAKQKRQRRIINQNRTKCEMCLCG